MYLKRRFSFRDAAGTAWYAALLGFSWLMLLITLQYLPIRGDAAFLQIKDDVTGLPWYLPAFFIHVFSALLVLAAGLPQFSGRLRRRFPRLHRGLGKAYVLLVLLLAAPSGFIIGMYGNGGFAAQLAFCLLALAWMATTAQAYGTARRRLLEAHHRWMIRSYALTLSAISLRLWKWLIVAVWHPAPMDTYRVVAWLGWVGNLIIAELIIRYSMPAKNSSRSSSKQGSTAVVTTSPAVSIREAR